MTKHAALPWVALFVFGAGWGIMQPLTKIAVTGGYEPFAIMVWQGLAVDRWRRFIGPLWTAKRALAVAVLCSGRSVGYIDPPLRELYRNCPSSRRIDRDHHGLDPDFRVVLGRGDWFGTLRRAALYWRRAWLGRNRNHCSNARDRGARPALGGRRRGDCAAVLRV